MRRTRHIPCLGGLAAIAALGVLLIAGGTAPGARSPQPKVSGLRGGAASVDDLVRRLLAALAARDEAALHALRVSRREYLDVILPGSVEAGRPPQAMPARKAEYFWELLDTKSRYGERHLLNEHGGRTLTAKRVEFESGGTQFATFKAHEQLRLVLEDEQGIEHELGTGSIAEVAGTFKFVSFIRD